MVFATISEKENRLTLDSGGFDLLLDPERADGLDVDELIDRVNRLGLLEQDTIMSLDFPVPHGDAIPITLTRGVATTETHNKLLRTNEAKITDWRSPNCTRTKLLRNENTLGSIRSCGQIKWLHSALTSLC